MRLALAAGLVACAAIGFCDRLVTIPISIKVPFGETKAEFYDLPSTSTSRSWLGVGVSRKLEIELEDVQTPGDDHHWTGGFAYQILPAITDTSPGLAVGFQDLANSTGRGRAAYAALTYRMSNDGELNQDIPTELTIGFWTAHQGLVFLGISLPFSEALRIIGEHDGRTLIVGVDLHLGDGIGAKVVSEEQKLGLSLSWTGKF